VVAGRKMGEEKDREKKWEGKWERVRKTRGKGGKGRGRGVQWGVAHVFQCALAEEGREYICVGRGSFLRGRDALGHWQSPACQEISVQRAERRSTSLGTGRVVRIMGCRTHG
jgi:hypothetical protein